MSKQKIKTPLVSVIIANKNGEKFLGPCINSLVKEKAANYEIVVVDDGSTGQSGVILKKLAIIHKQLRVLHNQSTGAASARNLAIANSCGQYLFFLDNDTVTKPGWSKSIPKYFQKYPKTGLAQIKLLKLGTNCFDYAGDKLSPYGFLIERARNAPDRGQYDQNDLIFGLKSAGAIMRRQVFEQIDGFDKDYKIYWEDTDLAWRTWLAGWEVRLASSITVWHAYNTAIKDSSTAEKNRVTFYGCRNQLTSLFKNLGTLKLIVIIPVAAMAWLTIGGSFIVRGNTTKGLEVLRGIVAFIAQLPVSYKKRKLIQKTRQISDQDLFALVGDNKPAGYYFGKMRAYLTNQPF